MLLLLTEIGTAQLLDDDEETILWSSDDDSEFQEEVSDEFLKEENVNEILDWLVDQDIITEEEAEEIEVAEDSLEAETDENSEPETGDDLEG